MPSSTTTAPRMTAAQFAARADALVGLPYVLGAEWGPSITAPKRPKALDCSELVEGLYRENGTPIGDLAASQYDRTKPITGSPKVGDLVFLRNNPARWNGIGHVAVLTAKLSNGDWRIVEARGRASGTVRTTLSYWRTRKYYAGIRRFPGFTLKTGTPPKPVGPRDFVFLQANLQAERFGGLDDSSPKVGEWLKKHGRASIMALCEVSEERRNAIRKVYGASKLLTWPVGYVANMWDASKWQHGGEKHVAFTLRTTGKPSPYHGAIRTPLDDRAGVSLDLISVHCLSRASFPKGWTDAQVLDGKLADVRAAMKALYRRGRPTIVAGDFNTSHAERVLVGEYGLQRATPNVDTVDTPGDQKLDAVFVTKDIAVRYAELLNPGDVSDHKIWKVGLRTGGSTT